MTAMLTLLAVDLNVAQNVAFGLRMQGMAARIQVP